MSKRDLLDKLNTMLSCTKGYIFDTYMLTDDKYKEIINDYEEAADLIAGIIDRFEFT